MNRDEYEARRQATSELARRVPATLDDATARQIQTEVAAAGIGHTVEGYEMACALLAERAPTLSALQRKTIAGHLSKAAAR